MQSRQRDLLVYVALANLRKKVPFGHLSQTLRADIGAFFGNYTRALEKGVELLHAAADPGEIEVACEDLQIGWQDEQALYFHRSLLNQLPAILRVYVGCATTLFGSVEQADLINLHKASGKVTFLVYDDFEGKDLSPTKNFATLICSPLLDSRRSDNPRFLVISLASESTPPLHPSFGQRSGNSGRAANCSTTLIRNHG